MRFNPIGCRIYNNKGEPLLHNVPMYALAVILHCCKLQFLVLTFYGEVVISYTQHQKSFLSCGKHVLCHLTLSLKLHVSRCVRHNTCTRYFKLYCGLMYTQIKNLLCQMLSIMVARAVHMQVHFGYHMSKTIMDKDKMLHASFY